MMKGCNAFLFYKYSRFNRLIYPVLFSGTIFVSTAVLADISPKVTVYTLQREKSSEVPPDERLNTQQPEIEILENSGVYQIKVVSIIDVPAKYVRYVLTDFKHIYRLNPSIIESEILKQHDDGSVSVRTKVIGCAAAYFCEELERVERVSLLPSGDLYAEIIPESSQFISGKTHWYIKSLGDRCKVTYISDMEPDVFIPPVVGKFLIKKSIREELGISFANLEKISGILAEREWQENYHSIHTAFTSVQPCLEPVSATYKPAY